MISELRISGLGVIEEAVVEPGPGFTALTGETGAGKTLILTALGMLLGGRVASTLAQSASVEAIFDVGDNAEVARSVAEAGGLIDSGELIIARTSGNGRLRGFLGGRVVPAQLLSELGDRLVVVHGQATQQRLRQPAAQRRALDRFGAPSHEQLLVDYRAAYSHWRECAQDMELARSSAQQTAQRLAFLRAGLDVIERIDPQPDEVESLRDRQNRLANAEQLQSGALRAAAALVGDDDPSTPSAIGLLYAARRELEALSDIDPTLQELVARLTVIAEDGSDIASTVTATHGSAHDDPAVLEDINQRLHDIKALMPTYGHDVPEVLEWARSAAAEVDRLERSSDVESLTERHAAAHAKLGQRAAQLHNSRLLLAQDLAAAATDELRELAMPNASITIAVTDCEPGADGADEVRFDLIPHPGAPAAPLAKGASGGELSRVMLALEVVLAQPDGTRTFIFDEIDAGVGGAAAAAIGRRLARLAKSAQVIVVTHMPQVAAWAQTHLRVRKDDSHGVTTSDVTVLQDEDRILEIARMLAGEADSAHARAHAEELLTAAGVLH